MYIVPQQMQRIVCQRCVITGTLRKVDDIEMSDFLTTNDPYVIVYTCM